MKRLDFEKPLLALLAAHPEGLSAAGLRALLKHAPSQPTLSRRLLALRARGEVVQEGAGPATTYRLAGGRLRVAELRSQALHRKVAEKLLRDPALRDKALARLETLRRANPAGRRYHDRWEQLLQGDLPPLLRMMTEPGETADTLRKASPFAGLLSQSERSWIFRQFATSRRTTQSD